MCTALCMHRLICETPNLYFGSLRLTNRSLRSTRGPTPAPSFNNKTPTVPTHRLVGAPPCVSTAKPKHRLAALDKGRASLDVWANPHTHRLHCVCIALCVHGIPYAPPCVWTAKTYLRLAALDKRLASIDAGAGPRTPLEQQDSCGGHRPPCVCTALGMHRLVCRPSVLHFSSPHSTYVSLRLTRGPTPTHPLNCGGHKPPCVCTALCMHRLLDRRTFASARCT